MKKRRIVWAALGVAVAAAVAVTCYVKLASPPPAKPFDGVRGRAENVTYVQDDPASGNQLVVRAKRSVTKDAKVGTLFRSPLKQETQLEGVEAELKDRDQNLIVAASSAAGTYNLATGAVQLPMPQKIDVRGRRVTAEQLELRPDGSATIKGSYEAFEGDTSLGKGMNYEGPAREIGRKRR